jgi:DNA polymerase-3 subunit beta
MWSVDTKKLYEFLQSLASNEVTIEFEGTVLRVKTPKAKAPFPLSVAKETKVEFVKMDDKVAAEVFSRTVKLALFARSQDASRPALSSLYLCPDENGIKIVATDGFRLSVVKAGALFTLRGPILVPGVILDEVASFPSTIPLSVGVSSVDEKIIFQQGDKQITSQLMTGDFPAYEKVLVKNFQVSIFVNKKEFLHSLKSISVFAKEYSNIVVCTLREGKMILLPKKEAGGGIEVEMEALETKYTGELQIAFNIKYLQEYLGCVDDEWVTLRINRPEAPVLFLAGKVEDEEDEARQFYQHIIMPIRLQ